MLKTQVEQLLTSAAEDNGESLAQLPTEAGKLCVELSAVDSIACGFSKLELTGHPLADAPMDRLREVAAALSQRLSYLLEPVRPIEVDGDQCVIQMRSQPPQRSPDQVRYYELEVSRQRLALVRYAKRPREAREVVRADVTREVLVRLATDFVDAVS